MELVSSSFSIDLFHRSYLRCEQSSTPHQSLCPWHRFISLQLRLRPSLTYSSIFSIKRARLRINSPVFAKFMRWTTYPTGYPMGRFRFLRTTSLSSSAYPSNSSKDYNLPVLRSSDLALGTCHFSIQGLTRTPCATYPSNP